MTKEKQRIAIAEACKWTHFEEDYDFYGFTQKLRMTRTRWRSPQGFICPEAPDYLNDLNAMHEAEESLTSNQWEVWWQHMGRILPDNYRRGGRITAAQRAEAFLRVIGKWEECRWQDDAEDGGEYRRGGE